MKLIHFKQAKLVRYNEETEQLAVWYGGTSIRVFDDHSDHQVYMFNLMENPTIEDVEKFLDEKRWFDSH